MTDQIETARDIATEELDTLYDRCVATTWRSIYGAEMPDCSVDRMDDEFDRHLQEFAKARSRALLKYVRRRSLRALGGGGADAR